MELTYRPSFQIAFPQSAWQVLVGHCRRKLARDFLAEEPPEPKAFGLVAGVVRGEELEIKRVFPLLKNARGQAPYKQYMDTIMGQHAIPSETPLENRGWVADPAELLQIRRECQRQGFSLLGTYHMHRLAWDHDQERDTPTDLDTILAKGSRMYMFIVSMVAPERPVMRAYFEGVQKLESPIRFTKL